MILHRLDRTEVELEAQRLATANAEAAADAAAAAEGALGGEVS